MTELRHPSPESLKATIIGLHAGGLIQTASLYKKLLLVLRAYPTQLTQAHPPTPPPPPMSLVPVIMACRQTLAMVKYSLKADNVIARREAALRETFTFNLGNERIQAAQQYRSPGWGYRAGSNREPRKEEARARRHGSVFKYGWPSSQHNVAKYTCRAARPVWIAGIIHVSQGRISLARWPRWCIEKPSSTELIILCIWLYFLFIFWGPMPSAWLRPGLLWC